MALEVQIHGLPIFEDSSSSKEIIGIHIHFTLTISKSSKNNNGIYVVQMGYQNRTCTIARINVRVRETTICTTLLVNEGYLKLSCAWMFQEDKMQLVANQTLPINEFITGMEMSCNVTTRVSSSLVAIGNAFDNYNRIPHTCRVSSSQLEVHDQCEFSVFMSPKTNEILDEGNVSFTCCINDTAVPSVWWYTETTELLPMNTSGQWSIRVASGISGSVEIKTSVILVCGEEKNDNLFVFGIGKIDLISKNYDEILLSGKTEKESATSAHQKDETKCQGVLNIGVTAVFLRREHKSDMSDSTTAIFTSDSDTPSAQTENPFFISIAVALIISALLNIATCANKCFRMTCRKKSAESMLTTNDPHISLTSIKEDDDRRIEMGLKISELPRVVEEGIRPHQATNKNVQEQESPLALRCKNMLNVELSEKRNQNFVKPTGERKRKALTPTAHPSREMVVSKEPGQITLSEKNIKSYEYEPIGTPGQNQTTRSLSTDGNILYSCYYGHTSDITIDLCTGSVETSFDRQPTSIQPTEGISSCATTLDQKTHQAYENLDPSDTFCSSVATEADDFYETVEIAEQENDYMSLQKNERSCNPVYQALMR